jgi:hypothetical protein
LPTYGRGVGKGLPTPLAAIALMGWLAAGVDVAYAWMLSDGSRFVKSRMRVSQSNVDGECAV